MMIKLAVLVSAGGTTMQNLIDRIADGRLDAQIVQVVSSNEGVAGIDRAKRAGLPVTVITRKAAGSREEFSKRIFDQCRQAGAELVCMAGFLQLITVPDDYIGRVMNIHPALIPAFCGKGYYGHHVHEAVLAYGAKISGCTVHFADNEYDHGPIILQKPVPVFDYDSVETLTVRVYEQECEAYPEAITLFGQGRLQIDGRIVKIRPARK
jgi:formyltetrahydrofolate-dependent phosphoribosylglycinamide formyltransferase